MSFLVDTDHVSAHLRSRRPATAKFMQYAGRLNVSAVTLAELKTWIYRASTPDKLREGFAQLVPDLVSLPVDDAVAEVFGQLGASFRDRGVTLPTPDLLIAATALVHDLTLVTGNTRHFAGIPDLRMENWLA